MEYRYRFFAHVIIGITVAVGCLRADDYYESYDDSSDSSSESGQACRKKSGWEPNFYDYDCKTFYSCEDYWGTLHVCPEGKQFDFDHKVCLDDEQVLCKWQLENHDSYGSSDSYSMETSCDVEYGLEPNYDDERCKTYFSCNDHWGVIKSCPAGYQFHFEHKDCEKDQDVLCKWQLESSGSSASSSGSLTMGSLVSQSRLGSNRMNSASVEGHICKKENGYEPNYDDSEECSSYWSCEDYWGTLQRCHGSDQFHFQYSTCMNDDDVSCWVQMEKYYHGYRYGSGQEGNSEYSSDIKTCEISQGQEPNMYDEGCKSYWYCEDHHGTLQECPKGYQFHWEKLDCVSDKDVICEKQMEYYYEHIYYYKIHPEEREGGNNHTGTDNSDQDWLYHSGSLNSDRQFRCDVESGRQADVDSKSCRTYWMCSGYQGTLERCPSGYQFHWDEKECLKNNYVDCTGQRDSYTHYTSVNPN